MEDYEEIELSEDGENEEGGLNYDWVVVKGRQEKQRRNPNKVAEEGGAVMKERLTGKRATRRKAPKKKGLITIKQMMIQDDVVEKMGLMMDPANQIKGDQKVHGSNTGGLSQPSTARNQLQVVVDMEVEEVEGKSFADQKGRRKLVGEEEAERYRNVANDHELIDRKFCETYEHLLGTIK